MSVYNWEDGIVDSSEGGPVTLTTSPLQTTRRTLYVDQNYANASDSNDGSERHAPKATLASAYSAANAGEVIWVAPGHVETITLTVAKIGLSIIGGGQGTSRPTLKCSTGLAVITVTAASVEIDNFIISDGQFDGDPADIAVSMIVVDALYCHLRRLTIVIGSVAFPRAITVGEGADAQYCVCRELEIFCTTPIHLPAPTTSAGTTSIRPIYGIFLANATQSAIFEARDCLFNGGLALFRFGAIHSDVGVSGIKIWGNTLESGATIRFTSSSMRGMFSNNHCSPSSRISLAAHIYEYPNGLVDHDEDGGHEFLAGPNVILTALPLWVNSATGSNSNAGTNRKRPLASILTAIGSFVGAGGGVVICEKGHTETWNWTVESTRVITKNDFKLYGLGTTSDRPTLRATSSDLITHPTVGPILRFEGTNSELHGFQFPVSTVPPTSYRITLAAGGCTVEGCDFTCGALDANTLATAEVVNYIENNTATVSALGPVAWAVIAGAVSSYDVVDNNSVDGGSYGFSTGGIYVSGVDANIVLTGNTLLNGAAMVLPLATMYTSVVATIAESSQVVEWI